MIETNLFTWLKTNVPLVANRVYAVQAPQDVVAPYLVSQKIDAPRSHTHQGADGLVPARFQFTSVDTTYNGAKLVAEQLRGALDGKAFIQGTTEVSAAFLDDETDDHDPDAALFWIQSDYIIQYKE